MGAKRAVMVAPTFHYYRGGQLLATFSGAMPNKLVELLDEHKGKTPRKRGGSKLLTLLGVLTVGGALLVFFNSRGSKPAPAPPVTPSPPPPQEEAAAEASAGDEAVPPPPDAAPTREPQAPVKKQAAGPSKGARHAQ